MTKSNTLALLSIGLVIAGFGLHWSVGQCKAQPVSPTHSPAGREGVAMDPNKQSSLVNPLTLDGVNDGIFPDAAKAALLGPGGIVPSLARVGKASARVE